MDHHLHALAFLLAAFTLSACSYRHKGARYARGKQTRIDGGKSFRLVYRYIQVSTLVVGTAVLLTSWPVWLRVHDDPWLTYLGIAIGVIGLAGFLWAKGSLGGAYSPCFDSYVPPGVVHTGIYGYVRHPIYAANLLLVLGLFLASGSAWIAINVALLAAYYIPAALREEAALSADFAEYRHYVMRTKRFIPFVV